MKKLGLIISILCYTFFLFSCGKKNNDNLYSCDSKINDWASSNKARLGNYDRQQLSSVLSIDSQKAIYRTMGAVAKCNIWKEKLQWILDSTNFTTAEKAHILLAYNYLEPSFYVDSNSLAPLNTWSENWANDGINQFGWDSVKVFLICETHMSPSELNTLRNHIVATNGGQPNYANGGGGSGGGSCDCRSAVGCQWFVESCNKSGGCGATYDCGLFGTSRCTGSCSGGMMATTTIYFF